MSTRREFLKSTSAVALAPMAISCSNGTMNRTKSPNIVLLMVDDFGWKDFHYKRDTYSMPHMHQLAEEGVTFTDAYATCPTCSPTRASVLTGQHPARLRIVRHIPSRWEGEYHTFEGDPVHMPSKNWLPLEVDTIGNALGARGYHTAFFGKWHLGHEPYFPVHHGFDEQFGTTQHGHPQSYYPPYFKGDDTVYDDAPEEKYLTDRLTDDAVHFLQNYDKPQPFLMTLFYYGVHGPFEGRRDLVEKYRKQGLEGDELQHAAMISAADESIGRIRQTLEEQGLSEDTVIVFLGDQGSAFPAEELRGGKKGGQAVYEGGARIPFVVHWPGVVAPGSNAQPVLTDDIFPTLVGIAGGNPSTYANLDGENLTQALKSGAALNRNEIIIYRSYEDQYAGVRRGKWKLVAYRSGKTELFDLENDLAEIRELSNLHPDIVSQLTYALYTWEKEMGVEELSGYTPKQ
jgi:arylsulfatase A-like enzyme